MIVVSDTSPLTALLTVGQANLIPALFGEVVVPQAVGDELLRWHSALPGWLRIKTVLDRASINRFSETLDAGESEAIALAKELRADHLLMDERKGRRVAAMEGLSLVGLLGVVLLARRRQLIPSARVLLERLDREAGVYLSEPVRETALRSVGE